MSISDWSLVGIFVSLASFSCFVLGHLAVDVHSRFVYREKREKFRRWKVDCHLMPNRSWWTLAFGFFSIAGASSFFSYLLIVAVQFYFDDSRGVDYQKDSFPLSVLYLLYVIALGVFGRVSRVRLLLLKADRLEALPLYFRDRLNTSQLAAIYDILVRGPAVLWEDFAGLTDLELVRDGVRRYRDLTTLHFTIQSLNYVRIGVGIGVVGLVIAFIALALQVEVSLDLF